MAARERQIKLYARVAVGIEQLAIDLDIGISGLDLATEDQVLLAAGAGSEATQLQVLER